MKVHCICHEPFEGLAFINKWVDDGYYELEYTKLYLGQRYPVDFDFNLLIIMGGAASICDMNNNQWLIDEKKFVFKAIERKIKILGICLGAQILANVLGARVYPSKEKEIGWFPIKFTSTNLPNLPSLPKQITTFHWHGDTFDIPEGAIQIASSEATPNQGFIFEDHILGLQFHLEMTAESLREIVNACNTDLSATGKYVQSAKDILSNSEHFAENNRLMKYFLDFLTK